MGNVHVTELPIYIATFRTVLASHVFVLLFVFGSRSHSGHV